MKQQPNPTDAEQTDALVDMIEQLMENGSGHLVVSEQDSQEGGWIPTAAWIVQSAIRLVVSQQN